MARTLSSQLRAFTVEVGPVALPVSVTKSVDPILIPGGHIEPDPHWQYVDLAGHAHRRIGRRVTRARWVVDAEWYCADHDHMQQDGHWECRTCGEWLAPGVRTAPDSYIPGAVRFDFVAETYLPVPGLRVGHRYVVDKNGELYATVLLHSHETDVERHRYEFVAVEAPRSRKDP